MKGFVAYAFWGCAAVAIGLLAFGGVDGTGGALDYLLIGSAVAPAWYQQQWKAGVTHVYQSKGFTLKNATQRPVKMDGDKMYFLRAGIGTAEEDVRVGDVAIPMNPADDKVEVTTKKSRAFDEVYEDELDQLNADYRQVVNERSAMALGRVHDKTIINAIDVPEVVQEVGSYTTPITPVTLLQARQKLRAAHVNVSDGNVFAAVDSVQWAVLLTYDQFVNSQYVGPNLPYVQAGLARTWNGIHVFNADDDIFKIANTTEINNLMWHSQAVGFGWVRQLTGTVQWDNRKDCWTHNMRMRIGAKLILPPGVVRMRADYDPAHITLPA